MNFKRGAGLLETLTYVAILAVITVIVFNVVISVFFAYERGLLIRRVSVDAETAMERMTREIRLASSIDDGLSSFGSHPSRIVLNTSQSHEDPAPAVKDFHLSDGRLALSVDGGAEEFLMSDSSEISSFVVDKIDTGQSQGLKISFTMEISDKRNRVSENFYQTVILKESY